MQGNPTVIQGKQRYPNGIRSRFTNCQQATPPQIWKHSEQITTYTMISLGHFLTQYSQGKSSAKAYSIFFSKKFSVSETKFPYLTKPFVKDVFNNNYPTTGYKGTFHLGIISTGIPAPQNSQAGHFFFFFSPILSL